MFRTSDIILIAVMVSAAAFTYKVKREAEDELSHARKLQTQIHFEEDTITLLKADWSLLTQPARLQKLSETFQNDLKLAPVDPHQYAKIADIPMRSLDIQQIIDRSHDVVVDQGTDETTTGAVQE